ncbi:MAG: ammonia-forming cytochrome c nitrite reductase subunit c552 [Chloroflexota bacterium]|nr:ammonia-forming cytochrome c nitrite reductase subunit c552 [Chloroflexota bacterium]
MKKVVLILGIAAVVIVIAGVGFWEYHKQPQFCGTCHEMEPYVESLNQPASSAGKHAAEGMVCLDCHEPTIEQQVHELVVHVQGDFRVPLKQRKFENEFCFDCHLPNEHTSYEQVIERTQDYIIDGENVNPHDPHADVEGAEQERRECYVCHEIHGEGESPEPDITYCYGCHHSRTFVSCNECHRE